MELENHCSAECVDMSTKMDMLIKYIHRSSNNYRAAKVIASVLDNNNGFSEELGTKDREGGQLVINHKKAKELVECLSCILQKYLVNQDLILIYYLIGAFFALFVNTNA